MQAIELAGENERPDCVDRLNEKRNTLCVDGGGIEFMEIELAADRGDCSDETGLPLDSTLPVEQGNACKCAECGSDKKGNNLLHSGVSMLVIVVGFIIGGVISMRYQWEIERFINWVCYRRERPTVKVSHRANHRDTKDTKDD